MTLKIMEWQSPKYNDLDSDQREMVDTLIESLAADKDVVLKRLEKFEELIDEMEQNTSRCISRPVDAYHGSTCDAVSRAYLKEQIIDATLAIEDLKTLFGVKK